MVQLSIDTKIRIWFDDDRFIDIAQVNNYEDILVQHFQAPGGHSYAKALNMQPNTYNSIVIK
jgi:hypothetical protein